MTQTDIYMYSQEGSHVSPSHLQENVSARKMTDGCGRNIGESSTKQSRIGLLQKMLPRSPVFQNLPASIQTWKKKVTKSGFSIYAPQMSARPIYANGALSLPTPATSQDYKPVRPQIPSEKAGTHGTMLCAALSNPNTVAKLFPLPTPCASDWKRQKALRRDSRTTQDLAYAACRLQNELETAGFTKLPTPLASRLTEPVRSLKLKETLQHSEPGQPRYGKMLAGVIGTTYPSLIGRYIHPQFVEWMMGFPQEWTNPDCNRSAMQLCHEWYTQYLTASDASTKVNCNE